MYDSISLSHRMAQLSPCFTFRNVLGFGGYSVDLRTRISSCMMRSFSALLLTTLASVANGVAVPRQARQVSKPDFDAVIVGGGPAGLSALSGLARVRRNALLIDSGEYRNAATRHMHDVIGFDGRLASVV